MVDAGVRAVIAELVAGPTGRDESMIRSDS
jgi:hypothetical protein